MPSISTLFSSLQKGFLKNVLEGAGITLLTSGALLTALNAAVSAFKSSLSGIAGSVLGLAGVAGLDVFFTLILGAIAARYIQQSAKLTLARK